MSIESRLRKLEKRANPSADPFAIQFGDRPIRVRGEELTRQEFGERYPNGYLIHFPFSDETARKLQRRML